MSAAEDVWDAVLKTITAPTKAGQWLASLPRYKCPGCGEETIFKSGCGECLDKEEAGKP
jgi:hypothetical protein